MRYASVGIGVAFLAFSCSTEPLDALDDGDAVVGPQTGAVDGDAGSGDLDDGLDSGLPEVDAGTNPSDGGPGTTLDAGQTATDSGAPKDAGAALDAGAPKDAGTVADAGAPKDAGVTTGFDAGALVFENIGTYGVATGGFLTWRERANMVLTNAVRIAPVAYKARFGVGQNPALSSTTLTAARYPAIGPIRYVRELNQSARAHSGDMASIPGCFQHNSCNGGDWAARIRSYYKVGNAIGENILYGLSEPRAALNLWLCDPTGTGTSRVCCKDGDACDGHRRSIMTAGFKGIGVGYAPDTHSPLKYWHLWTQDFGDVVPGSAPPLVDGSHIFMTTGETLFLATWYAAAAPKQLVVLVDGVASALKVDIGTAAKGTYSVALPRAAGCRSYYFIAIDAANKAYRYPASGVLRTMLEGTCLQN